MNQKKETEKVFESPSTGQMCSAAQYIAEIMCFRRAEKEKSPGLEYKFWNKTRQELYKQEIVAAQRLINKFDSKSILDFLKTDGKFVYSLGVFNSPKFIVDGIKKHFKINQDKSQNTIVPSDYNIESMKSRQRKSNNLFSRLKDIEDGR